MDSPYRIINTTSLTVQVAKNHIELNNSNFQTLSPGSALSIPDDNPSNILVRDAHSKKFLSIRKPIHPKHTLLVSDVYLVSKENGIPITLSVVNSTKGAIEICSLENNLATALETANSLSRLLPGTSITIPAKAETIYVARVHSSGRIIQTFISNQDPSQKFTVEMRSKSSDASSYVSVENQSSLSLILQWVDFDGTLRRTTPLDPGQKTNQDTFFSHPWILKDQHSGVVVDAFISNQQHQNWIFKTDNLRSLGGTKPTTVEFWNAAPFPIQLVRKDFNGEEEFVEMLLPGGRRIQPTNAGHVWLARHPETKALIQTFLPSPKEFQLCRIVPRDEHFQLPPDITFDNNTGLSVELVAKDESGTDRVFAILPHRGIHKQPTSTAERWFIRDINSGIVVEEVITTQEDFIHKIELNAIRSHSMDRMVEADFVNLTPFYIDVSWIDYDGKEEHFHRLKPNEKIKQPTHATHVWRFRERETRDILHLFIANEKASQQVDVTMRPIHSREPAGLEFRNFTGLTVEVLWFNKNGLPEVLRTLIPGRNAAFKTFATHPWILRDKSSGTVLKTIIAQPGIKKIDLNNLDIRSKRSDRSTTLIFNNKMPFAVDLHWLGYDGTESAHETILSGDRLTKKSYTTHPYRVRHHISKREVAVFLPTEMAKQEIDISFRAHENRKATSVEVRNMTTLTTKVFTIDMDGNEVFKTELAPREGVDIKTFSTFPIVVRDKVSNEPIAFTIASNQSQVLEVTSDILRSNRTEYPVWITWNNTLQLPIDLFWVKYDGTEEFKKTIAPHDNFKISSFPSHVWRARFQKSKTEVDLYITGEADQQSRNIGAVLPLRSTEREGGKLWPGEVALYEEANFGGKVWIAHGDLPDFAILSGFNDKISSLKVAPATAVSVFEDYYFNALPENRFEMAAEVRQVVVDVFSKQLGEYKASIATILTNLKSKKEASFVAQVDLIKNILDNAIDNTPKQIGLIIQKFIEGRDTTSSEQLSTVTLKHGNLLLEQDLQFILKSGIFTDDRQELAVEVLKILENTQAAIFSAFSAEWDGELNDEIQNTAARNALTNLGKLFQKTAEIASEEASPIIQKPKSDVFFVDAIDLADKDIGRGTISSIRVLKNIAPDKLRISSTNKVVDDPKVVNGELVKNPMYRTTIKFPPEVSEVQIWGTEETTFTIGERDYTVGPKDDEFATIKINPGGIMVLQLKPDRIGIPPLMLRTNSMPANGRVFIFPDADVHRKFAKMESDAFVNGVPDPKAPGGIRKLETKADAKDTDISSAQKAIQTLSKTSAASIVANATGTSSDRKIVVGRMDMSAFQLDFGSEQGAADTSFRPIDPASVHAQAVDAEPIGLGFFDDLADGFESIAVAAVDFVEDAVEETAQFFEDTAKAIAQGFEDLGAALEEAFNEIGDAFEAAGEWIEDRLEEGLEFIENTIEQAVEILEDIGDAIVDAANAVAEGVSKGLQIVIKAAGKVVTIVVDTLEKVGEVVMYIAEQVVEVVGKVIDFVCALFAWGDIMDTQAVLQDSVFQGMDKAEELIDMGHNFIDEKLPAARETIGEFLDDIRDKLGLDKHEPVEEKDDTSDGMDALMWLFDKISSAIGAIPTPGFPSPNLIPGFAVPDNIVKELEESGEAIVGILENSIVSSLKEAAKTFQRFFEQLIKAIGDPSRLPIVLGSIFMDLVALFLDIGLVLVEVLAHALLHLAKGALKLIRYLISLEIKIPIVKELYELITGQKMTLVSIATTLVAIPATIIGKLILGTDKFNNARDSINVSSLALASNTGGAVLKILYGCAHIVMSITGAIQDAVRIGGPEKKPHKFYVSLQLVKKETFLTLLNLIIAFPAFVWSTPTSAIKGDSNEYNNHSIASWLLQLFFMIPPVVGIGLAVKQLNKGHRELPEAETLGYVLTGLSGIGGLAHLGVNIALTIYESKESSIDTAMKAAQGIGYILTTIPPICEFAFITKNSYLQGGALGIRVASHIGEGISTLIAGGMEA